MRTPRGRPAWWVVGSQAASSAPSPVWSTPDRARQTSEAGLTSRRAAYLLYAATHGLGAWEGPWVRRRQRPVLAGVPAGIRAAPERRRLRTRSARMATARGLGHRMPVSTRTTASVARSGRRVRAVVGLVRPAGRARGLGVRIGPRVGRPGSGLRRRNERGDHGSGADGGDPDPRSGLVCRRTRHVIRGRAVCRCAFDRAGGAGEHLPPHRAVRL